MTDNTLTNILLIYSYYDPKDRSLVETSYLVFVLKTNDVEEDLLQLFYIKFNLISNVVMTINNDEINDIS